MDVMKMNYNFPTLTVDENLYKDYKYQTKDSQLSELPKHFKFCKKCVLTNQRPRTEFNEDGVCNACLYAEKKFQGGIDWKKREEELVELLNKHRSNDGSWDVIVPSSGGKDSMMVAHQLKHQYGMHPLTITWAPFIYTQIGYQNYYNSIQSGFDGLIAYPDGLMHRKLARIAFEIKGDPWEPFTYGQKAYAFNIAEKFKIPLMFYGESGEIEYGGSFKNENRPYESPEDWDELYFKGGGIDLLIKEGLKMGILTKEELKNSCLDLYKAPAKEVISDLGLQMHWWSYYHCWIPQENYYYVADNTGFEASPKRTPGTYTKYLSIDDQLDPFHWLLAYLKFGYGRATREACSDIRCGHITRDEGVALVQRYDKEFPVEFFKQFLNYLDISEEHFWNIMDRYRTPHIWNKDSGTWKLNKIVANDKIEGITPAEEMQPNWENIVMGKIK